jgi:capsular polysaccharide biosynthesis protein/Mrp family chromosome partitioning ATPase
VSPDDHGHPRLTLRSLLVRGVPLAIICAAACAVAAGMISDRRDRVYSASATVLIRESTRDPVAGSASPEIEGAGVGTESLLVDRRAVLAAVARRTRSLSLNDLDGAVAVSPVGKTNALQVTASTSDPRQAAEMANAVAREFVSRRRRDTATRARKARRVLREQFNSLDDEAQGSLQGSQITERIQSLTVLEKLGATTPRLIQSAQVPVAAVSPDPQQDAIFGGIFGLVLGAGLAVLWVGTDRRVRDLAEASSILGVPVLGSFKRRRGLGRLLHRRASQDQLWRLVLMSLRHRPEQDPVRTVSITPAHSGDGGSHVAFGLATTAAAAGGRALFIGLESERRGEASKLGPDRLGAVLAGHAQLADAISPVGSSKFLDFLVGQASNGRPMPLSAQGLTTAVRQAAQVYDLVVIDTPSLLERADGVPVISQADSTIVVVSDHVDREQLLALRERLDGLQARVLGLVVNRS